MAKQSILSFHGIDLELLKVSPQDKVSLKLLMLVEGVYGIGVKKSIKKYGYTEQRYYQLLKAFHSDGSDALVDKKEVPRKNHKRDERTIQQIIRYRFLDPKMSAAVIAQKLNQIGISISQRSVERTIQEYGLQKKTLPVKSHKGD
ncbi:MAG: helix-turn-helix domain-containing protein [Methylotenera sp.]